MDTGDEERMEAVEPDQLAQIAAVLGKIPALASACEAIKSHAAKQAPKAVPALDEKGLHAAYQQAIRRKA
eukprot:7718107-Alexandrium_andersonii.AAC.1